MVVTVTVENLVHADARGHVAALTHRARVRVRAFRITATDAPHLTAAANVAGLPSAATHGNGIVPTHTVGAEILRARDRVVALRGRRATRRRSILRGKHVERGRSIRARIGTRISPTRRRGRSTSIARGEYEEQHEDEADEDHGASPTTPHRVLPRQQRAPVWGRVVVVLVVVFSGECATNPHWSTSAVGIPSRSSARRIRWNS